MGSSSRSRSSQSTNNNSVTFGIQGDNHGQVINGSGNTITDGGAFSIVSDIANMLPDLFSGGLNAITDIAGIGADQNQALLDAGVDLYAGVADQNEAFLNVSENVLSNAGNILSDGFETYADQLSETNQLALEANASLADSVVGAVATTNDNMRELAEESMLQNANLAGHSIDTVSQALANANDNHTELAQRAISSAEQTSLASNKFLVSGFEDMMNFANTFSRSDGAELAKNNTQTIALVSAVAVVAFISLAIVTSRSKK